MSQSLPEQVVLDASIAVRWFFSDEPLHTEALAYCDQLVEQSTRAIVPHVFWSELVHVLARKSGRDQDFVTKSASLCCRLGLRTLSLDEAAWQQVANYTCQGLSGYDATYLALATSLGVPWLTADAQAAKKVAGPCVYLLS